MLIDIVACVNITKTIASDNITWNCFMWQYYILLLLVTILNKTVTCDNFTWYCFMRWYYMKLSHATILHSAVKCDNIIWHCYIWLWNCYFWQHYTKLVFHTKFFTVPYFLLMIKLNLIWIYFDDNWQLFSCSAVIICGSEKI